MIPSRFPGWECGLGVMESLTVWHMDLCTNNLQIVNPDTGDTYVLGPAPITLGRTSQNDIPIPTRIASKHHAKIVFDGADWILTDLDSTNGTFVNDRRVASHPLESGDTIRIGDCLLQVQELRSPNESMVIVDDDSVANPLRSAKTDNGYVATMCVDDNMLARIRAEVLGAGRDSTAVPAGLDRRIVAERKLDLIQLIGEMLIHQPTTGRFASAVTRLLVRELRADRGCICLFEPDGSLRPVASYAKHKGDAIQVSRAAARSVQETQTGVLVNASNNPAARPADSLQQLNTVSTICVPLWTSDKITGILSIDSTTPGRVFEHDDLDVMLAVAHHAAIGMEQGRLAEVARRELSVRAYLSQYLDRKVVQRVVQKTDGEDPLAPAERVITVLFCDICSFTKMTEKLSPTDVSRFVRDYMTSMTEIIFQHGGTIDKYIGDEIMALFGAPISNPHAPRDAVRAAIAMKQHAIKDSGLRVRFGISTGPVVVGNIGSAQRVEYTALGDTVNVASRIETFARPNEICIDEETARNLSEQFAAHEIEMIDVRNRTQPVRIFKVLGELVGRQ